ncbi:Uu.00g075330.m01.CDS01 [Anthostomella pinea]|uniref:Uu.00g075330.m01.CDS01 n=1 Tax=Anthostomella pinea TaxID=933095 RepID=A0AAI8VWV2_9PEZI|nr:Uu.00g075330.m01.CDS01 [Anthostomella pinea]
MNCTLRADAAALDASSQIYSEVIEPLKGLEGIVLTLTLQTYTRSLLRPASPSIQPNRPI